MLKTANYYLKTVGLAPQKSNRLFADQEKEVSPVGT